MLHDFVLNMFQFHEGPIKTNCNALMVCAALGFNSMKVRLKLEKNNNIFRSFTGFNSMKVRLKLCKTHTLTL